jgi:cell shape-determining protein MreD
MKFLALLTVSFLLIIFQLSFLPHSYLFAWLPNLFICFAVAFVILNPKKENYWMVFVPVLLFDILSGNRVGLLTLSFFLDCIILDWLSYAVLKRSDLSAALILSLLGAAIYQLFIFILSRIAAVIFSGIVFSLPAVRHILLVDVAGGGAAAFVFYLVLRKTKLAKASEPPLKLK